jgi:hypothetical protein
LAAPTAFGGGSRDLTPAYRPQDPEDDRRHGQLANPQTPPVQLPPADSISLLLLEVLAEDLAPPKLEPHGNIGVNVVLESDRGRSAADLAEELEVVLVALDVGGKERRVRLNAGSSDPFGPLARGRYQVKATEPLTWQATGPQEHAVVIDERKSQQHREFRFRPRLKQELADKAWDGWKWIAAGVGAVGLSAAGAIYYRGAHKRRVLRQLLAQSLVRPQADKQGDRHNV